MTTAEKSVEKKEKKKGKLRHTLIMGAFSTVTTLAFMWYTEVYGVPFLDKAKDAGTVSYAVSNGQFITNASDSTKIDSVTFDLDKEPPAGAAIKARLVSSSNTWYACTNVGTAVTCATTDPQATVATATGLAIQVTH